MKNKIFKIMGVSLALVLAFTLGASFMPANTPEAEAGDLSWSKISPPSTTSNVLVADAEDLGPVAISPAYASDNTVFAVVNDTSTYPVVYKSTNGGHTWVGTTTNLGAAGDMGIALVLSPNFASDSTVFVAVQDPDAGGSGEGMVYRSTNGGSTFGQLGAVTLSGGEIITSMDVSPDYDGVGIIAIGIADRGEVGIAASTRCLQVWGSNDVLSWTAFTTDIPSNLDISAVKFSPNYAIDSTILTVASAADAKPYLRLIVGGVWSASLATDVGATSVKDLSRDGGGAAGYLNYASIAVPSDYDGTVSTLRRVYVSIVSDNATADTSSNVYRITGTTTGAEIATDMAKRLYPIDYSGTFAEGTLIGAYWEDTADTAADVYRTTNPTSSVVNWYGVSGAANKPTGTAAATSANSTYEAISGWVQMSATYADDSTVIVGTQGKESAFGISTDGAASFNETGLIENANSDLDELADVGLSPNYGSDSTLFLISDSNGSGTNDTNVWVSTNGGSYWDRCFLETWETAGETDGAIALSDEFDTDSVVYVGDQGGTDVYYSGNGGRSWSGRAVAAGRITGIQTMAAPDATTIYAGDSASGKVAKSTNSGWTWPSSLTKNTAAATLVASLKVKESTVLVGGGSGTVRRSDDGGATWSKVSGTLTAANVYVDFDDTFVWAVESGDGDIFRSEDGGAWKEIASTTTGDTAAVELILAGDGTLYAAEDDATGGWDVYRSIDPTAALPTPNATFQAMAATDLDIVTMDVVSGSSNIVAIIQGTNPYIYTDILSKGTVGPTLASPDDGSTLTRARDTRFKVVPMDKVLTYTVIYGTDDTFATYDAETIDAPDIRTAVVTLSEGAVTYWKARAETPLRSPWSEVWTVETQLITPVNAPTPAYPAGDDVMDVPIEPIFNWQAFKYASGYDFQLAKDPGMTDFIADLSGADALGNITSWKCTTTLAYDTTYYWRVRAIIGTSASYSDWSNIVGFTTMAKPVAPAPPVIIEPTPAPAPAPAPITPAYIYAIIAIGAVLVIVVIVLIVRTRRIP